LSERERENFFDAVNALKKDRVSDKHCHFDYYHENSSKNKTYHTMRTAPKTKQYLTMRTAPKTNNTKP
jgi:hypothetical protein